MSIQAIIGECVKGQWASAAGQRPLSALGSAFCTSPGIGSPYTTGFRAIQEFARTEVFLSRVWPNCTGWGALGRCSTEAPALDRGDSILSIFSQLGGVALLEANLDYANRLSEAFRVICRMPAVVVAHVLALPSGSVPLWPIPVLRQWLERLLRELRERLAAILAACSTQVRVPRSEPWPIDPLTDRPPPQPLTSPHDTRAPPGPGTAMKGEVPGMMEE